LDFLVACLVNEDYPLFGISLGFLILSAMIFLNGLIGIYSGIFTLIDAPRGDDEGAAGEENRGGGSKGEGEEEEEKPRVKAKDRPVTLVDLKAMMDSHSRQLDMIIDSVSRRRKI